MAGMTRKSFIGILTDFIPELKKKTNTFYIFKTNQDAFTSFLFLTGGLSGLQNLPLWNFEIRF